MKAKRAALALVLALCLGACGKTEEPEEIVEPQTAVEEPVSVAQEPETVLEETVEPEESIPTIYAEDELINRYLNSYNEAVTEDPIESGDFEVYYHHGSEHKDQILILGEAFDSVVISSRLGEIDITIEGGNAEEAYKEAFYRFARGYNLLLGNEELGEYWEQAMSNLNSYTQFDEFEIYIRSYNDTIELLEISGEVE